MLTCEEFTKKHLPQVRAKMARELSRQGMKQQDIAARLGITQAAVSKYLDRKYDARLRAIEGNRALSDSIAQIAKKLRGGPLGKGEMASEICRLCEKIYSRECSATAV